MVANTYRIIVETSELSKNNWNLIYRFIEKCYERGSFGKEDFDSLKEQAKIVIDNNPKDEDVYSCDGLDEIQFENLTENQNDWMFNIIYKAGNREDFGDLVPFFLLKKKYRENITFGIDVENVIKQNDYTFKCSIFLFFIKDKKPKIGNHSIYFIHEFNTKTGEIINVSALKYTQKENDYSKASPNFIPLLPINEENFKVFQYAKDVDTPLFKYISESIKKSKLDKNINFSSKFEEWFIKAYCSNCNITTDFEQFKPSLHDYYINIYELVQNIIFHTEEKTGLLYINFNKKEDMLKDGKTLYPYCNIPNIDTYENTQRFLEIGIYDYNEKGIIDTFFGEEFQIDEDINLKTFVDPAEILPIVNDPLSIRYAAHLGIKSFVSSVLHHKGYFCVESNYSGNKTGIECRNGKIEEEYEVDNISGTHYEIVLPVNKNEDVKDYKPIFGHSVFDSLKELLEHPYSIIEIQFEESWMSDLKNISNKDLQTEVIQQISNKIIDKSNPESATNALAIDMGKASPINTNILFKLLAHIQLNSKNNINSLILNNLEDSTIDDICEIIKDLGFVWSFKRQPIWSRDHALILRSKSLRTQIICGEEYPEICRVNQKINQFYHNKKNVFDKDESEQNETIDIDKFVLPYECVIENESGNLFLQYMEQILGTLLGTIEFGCLTDSKYTRIGSKLFLEHYYEADHVFKNSFFVDRLAYFIVKEIKNSKKYMDMKAGDLILIGYLPYSELLVKKVKEYLESLSNKIVYTSIAKEKENEHTNSLDFKISDELKKKIKETDNQNLYITIVPIASSLSTNDKVISIFKQKNEITSDNFLNFCSIVVRDQDESKVSDNEKAFKWKEIKTEDNIIYTNYAHAKEIHYTVSKSGIWHPLIDKTTFPKQYGEEKYINQTQNSSLNTKDRFGYPIAALPSIDEIKDELKISVDKEIEDEELYKEYYKLTTNRLEKMQNFIYVGHITHGNSHHRYYFNTEEYVRQIQVDEKNKSEFQQCDEKNKSEFQQWIDYLSKQNIPEHPVNILISPDNDYESEFVNYINQKIFGNNAMIIYVSIDNPRQNIKTKFSFLSKIKNPHFHFVDHALLTGETYHKTLSYINSIIIDYTKTELTRIKFDNVFTIINRLSSDKYNEIRNSLEDQIYSYIHFFVLPSKNPETDCSLCGLEKYYDNLKNHSVIASCRKIIENNKKKFEKQEFSQYSDDKKKKVSESSRINKRMEFRHRLFFEIAICGKQDVITERLNNIYDEYNCLDNRISFLKAITFPPLSQYVNIRSYAHQLTLNELGKTLEKVDPDINDLRFLKVLLKHLSWLNSNALVRKEVIEGSWKLYFRVYPKILEKQERKKAIDKEISELEKKLNSQKELAFELEYNLNNKKEEKKELDREDEKDLEKLRDNFQDDFQFYIKNATYDDEAKSLWLGELMKTGQEPNYENGSIEISKTELDNEFFRDPFLTFARELIYEIDIETQQVLAEKYYMFAEKTFNDNTTIFRKSLNNFKYELDKDKDLSKYYHYYYYVEDNGETKERKELIKYKDFIRQKDAIISKFIELVKEQYYYTWFKYYLQKKNDSIEDRSSDEIPLIEKLSYLLYAKLYLNSITPNKDAEKENEKDNRSKDFQEFKELLEILKEILDADGAFVTAKYQGKTFYTIAKTKEMKYYDFDYESRNYLCKNIDSIEKKDQRSPIIIRENLSDFEERNMLDRTVEKAVLWTSKATIGINTVTITFIFKRDKNTDSNVFRIQKQELGRLLLLLTPQLNDYISHIRKEKIYDLWVEKTKQIETEKNKFSRVNIEENHTFSPQGWMFYNFLEDDKNNETEPNAKEYLISYTRMLSNMIVKDLYSQLTYYGEIRKPSPTKSTISEIFNSNFLDLLDILLESNKSYNIMYKLPESKDYDEKLKNFRVTLHIPILQGCIIQCLENAVKKCRLNNYVDSRKIKFSIQYDSNNNSVIIKLMNSVSDKIDINNENKVFERYYSDQAMSNLSKDEIINKKYRFSLLSLIKYCESMGIKCKRWFDVEKKLYEDEYGFCIEIIIPGK